MQKIYDVEDAIKFLQKAGTKAAVQVGYEGPYVFVVKSDFINMLKTGPRTSNCSQFSDYDGNTEYVFIEDNILYIPIGVTY